MKTNTNNADATFLGLVISNLASLDGVIAGLVNAFNIVEAAAWKTYTDAAAGAVKDWSHSMADYTETFANARIAAAVAFSHTEATEAKTAGDLIAAANTVWTNTMAYAAKVYSDAMAVVQKVRIRFDFFAVMVSGFANGAVLAGVLRNMRAIQHVVGIDSTTIGLAVVALGLLLSYAVL